MVLHVAWALLDHSWAAVAAVVVVVVMFFAIPPTPPSVPRHGGTLGELAAAAAVITWIVVWARAKHPAAPAPVVHVTQAAAGHPLLSGWQIVVCVALVAVVVLGVTAIRRSR
jgi:hypothetical protein